MNQNFFRSSVFTSSLLLTIAANLSAAEPAAGTTSEIKKITDRYTLTHNRISALLDQRLNPVALPANPPNPFYQVPKDVAGTVPAGHEQEPAETALVPEAADLSDGDTLKKYAATLKFGGVISRSSGSFLIINGTPCKAGDIIPAGNKDRPVYLKIISLAPNELILGLNEATLAVPLKN